MFIIRFFVGAIWKIVVFYNCKLALLTYLKYLFVHYSSTRLCSSTEIHVYQHTLPLKLVLRLCGYSYSFSTYCCWEHKIKYAAPHGSCSFHNGCISPLAENDFFNGRVSFSRTKWRKKNKRCSDLLFYFSE